VQYLEQKSIEKKQFGAFFVLKMHQFCSRVSIYKINYISLHRISNTTNMKISSKEVVNGTLFQVMNGNSLQLHPVKEPNEPNENLTGDYHQIWNYLPSSLRKGMSARQVLIWERDQLRVFTDNAFLLWIARDIIYSDSRLFLATVFTGNHTWPCTHPETKYPTLGAMLEWWECCSSAHLKPFDEEELLIKFHGGGPEPKECYSVNVLGHVGIRKSTSFMDDWHSLVEINSRYHTLRREHEAYSMSEVVSIITEQCPRLLYEFECMRHEADNLYNNREITEWMVEAEEYEHMYYDAIIEPHRGEIIQMITQCTRLEGEAVQMAATYKELEEQVKNRKITQSELLEQWLPLKKQRASLLNQSQRLLFQTFRDAFPKLVKTPKDARDLYLKIEKHLYYKNPLVL